MLELKQCLLDIEPGKIINNKYIILEHSNIGTLVLSKNFWKVKGFGSTNNWARSETRQELNTEFLAIVEAEFGAENIIVHKSNLLSLDGLNDYGICRDKISLLDVDQYRRLRKVIGPNKNRGWFLLTPYSTPLDYGSEHILFIYSNGCVDYDKCTWSRGIRPFFILNSHIFVSTECQISSN